jgi:uncharacterized protein
MDNKFDIINDYVKNILSNEATGHDYFHSIRVMNNAVQISAGLDIDIEVVKLACLTHDLIDKKVTSNIELSKRELINKLRVAKYDETTIKELINIIENVSYSKGNTPSSLEGKIVQDADRLDALGAIGIARAFAYGGNNNRLIYNPGSQDNSDTVYHYYDKLFKLTDLMNTANAKAIAVKRTEYMKEYLTRFYAEWEGKDLK